MSTAQSCFHCNLPVPANNPWVSEINGEQCSFCCPGCLAVANTIQSVAGNDYYRLRSGPAATYDSQLYDSQINDYSQYDETTVQQSFIRQSDNVSQAELLVDNVHCSACCWLIEKVINQLPGVTHCNLNLSQKKLFVEWQQQITPLSKVLSTLASIGYPAKPFSATELNQQYHKQSRQLLIQIGIAGIVMMQVGMCSLAFYVSDVENISQASQQLLRWYSLLLTAFMLPLAAHTFYRNACNSLLQLRLSMDVPVVLAITAAFIVSVYVVVRGHGDTYFESISMFVFFLLIARFIELRSRHDNTLWQHDKLQPTVCTRRLPNQKYDTIAVQHVKPDMELLVRAGDTVPVDGIVTEGHALLNESSLNGEFLPVSKSNGHIVYAGTILQEGQLHIKARTNVQESQLAHIQRLVDKALAIKSRTANAADQVARYFTGFILTAAGTTAIVCSYLNTEDLLPRVLAVLVVSCPCALALATPSAITVANRALQKIGLFVIKPNVIERLNGITDLIIDKTGTVTVGELTLGEVQCAPASPVNKSACLNIASALETLSEHPIASAFQTAANTTLKAEKVQVVPCEGVEGTIAHQRYRLGSKLFCQQWHAQSTLYHEEQTEPGSMLVWLISEKDVLCRFELRDKVRTGAHTLMHQIQSMGIYTHLLSGDTVNATAYIAEKLNIDSFCAEQKPEDKLLYLRQLNDRGRRILVLGDGLNDTPMLSAATVSVVMPNASDFAKTQGDIVLTAKSLQPVAALISHAKRTRQVIYQNLMWALLYNITAIPLAAMGLVPPYLAALGMSLSSIFVVLNAARLRSSKGMNIHTSQSNNNDDVIQLPQEVMTDAKPIFVNPHRATI